MSKAASGELSPLGKTSSVGSGLPASYDASDAEKLDELAPRSAENLLGHAVRKSCKSPAFADYSEKLLFDGPDGALCQALMAARGSDFRIGPELRLIDEFPDLFRDLSIHDIGSLCTMAVMMFRPLKSSVGASGGDSPSSEPENGTAARPRADVLHPSAEARREP